MNIEELKQVAEMVGDLGDTAGTSFYAWIGLQVFENVWHSAVFILVLWAFYKIFSPVICSYVTEGAATIALKVLREELNTGTSGELISAEIAATIAKVRELNQ